MSDPLDILFTRLRTSPFAGVDPNSVPQEGKGNIEATGFVNVVENADRGVVIDKDGITIRFGALTLIDQFGSTVITGAGFGASWLDFLSSGFYNDHFQVGTTTEITAATEVSGADSDADYLASLSDDIPYWIVASESGAGTLKRVADSTAVGGFALQWAGTETAEVYQDIPIVPGQSYAIILSWRYTNSASEFSNEVSYQWRTSDHAAIGSAVSQALSYTTSEAAYVPQLVITSDTAPASARYLRVFISNARISGSPTVWLNGVVAQKRLSYGVIQIGDENNTGELDFWNPDASGNIVTSEIGTEANLRFVIERDGSFKWGPGSATQDVFLYRSATKTLVLDANGAGGFLTDLQIYGDIHVGGSGAGNGAAGILLDAGGSIEIAADGGSPFIDFKNDLTPTDFDARIILISNDYLRVEGITRLQVGTGTVEITIGHYDTSTERGAIIHNGQTGQLGNYVSGAGGAFVPAVLWGANATAALLGFYGTGPITKPTVSGSKGGNAALSSLMTALANLGLVVNSTT